MPSVDNKAIKDANLWFADENVYLKPIATDKGLNNLIINLSINSKLLYYLLFYTILYYKVLIIFFDCDSSIVSTESWMLQRQDYPYLLL